LEIEAIARLDHPNIIPLHEAGESGGLHYFTMKLATGGSLASALCEDSSGGNPLPPEATGARRSRRSPAQLRQWIVCMVKVSRAAHYAHQHNIVHRDLKPANILLDKHGEPMITDFGLAKILEENTDITQTRAVLGSPNYMAPEQAAGQNSAITASVDVYSLGAILYEILTGEPPFLASTALETIRKVMDDAPRTPRSLDSRVDRDLEMICLKCLEKEPERRYSSAAELADELQRWIDGAPLQIRPAGQSEVFWRWCKRQPAMAAAIGAVLAFFALAAAGSTFAAVQIRAAQRETEAILLRMQLEKADQLLEANDASRGIALLADITRRHPEKLDAATRLAFELSSRSHAMPASDPLAHESKLLCLGSGRNGGLLFTATENGLVRRWNAHSGELESQVNTGQKILSAAFCAAGEKLAIATDEGAVQIWQSQPAWTLLRSFRNEHTAAVRPVFIHPAGRLLGAVPRLQATALFWDLETGEQEFQISEVAPILAAAISPDGERVAFGLADGRVTIWDLEQRQGTGWVMSHDSYVTSVAFSPDGRYLCSGSNDQTARVWDLSDEAKLALIIHHKHEIMSVHFSDDSRLVATAGLDRAIQVWDIAESKLALDPILHSEGVTAVRFLDAGRRLAAASYKNMGWLWRVHPAIKQPITITMEDRITSVAVSRCGNMLAVGCSNGIASVRDARTGREIAPVFSHNNVVSAVEFSPDHTQLLTASFDGAARVWDLATTDHRALVHEGWVRKARFNNDGTRVITAAHDSTARIWDLNTGNVLTLEHDGDVEDAVFSNDGQRAATGSKDNFARVWNTETGALLAQAKHESWVSSIQFSPDDRAIVTSSFDKTACLWRLSPAAPSTPAPRLAPLAVLRHDGEVAHASFSPNGRWVVTASYDGSARVWHVSSGAPKPYVLSHKQPVLHAEFSQDNRRVLTASRDGATRVWSVESGVPLTGSLRHSQSVRHAAFGPRGDWVVSGSCDHTARIWPLAAAALSQTKWLSDQGQSISRMKLGADGQFIPFWPAEKRQTGK
jgi:eukaryotic-like serine/threonine-protein kinase